jgi:hypothetical protein
MLQNYQRPPLPSPDQQQINPILLKRIAVNGGREMCERRAKAKFSRAARSVVVQVPSSAALAANWWSNEVRGWMSAWGSGGFCANPVLFRRFPLDRVPVMNGLIKSGAT